MDTTEPSFDGTIEGAIASLINEPQEVEEVESEEESEDVDTEVDTSDEEEEPSEEDDSEEEADEDDAEEAEDSEPEAYTVKVDGKEQQVTLEELKRGYSGQQYVQKGMQEAANLRKQAEQVYSALLSERQQISQIFQQVQAGGLPQAPKAPSKEMFESDPIGYMEAKLQYDESIAAYNAQMGQLQQVAAQQSQAEQMAAQAYLQREMETLKAVVPEFANPEEAGNIRNKLLTKGQEVYGYSPEEIAQVMDHRAVRVLLDAVKYQELMSGKDKAVDKAKPRNRKVVKAGAKKVSSKGNAERQARSKLKRSGRIEDALGLLIQE